MPRDYELDRRFGSDRFNRDETPPTDYDDEVPYYDDYDDEDFERHDYGGEG